MNHPTTFTSALRRLRRCSSCSLIYDHLGVESPGLCPYCDTALSTLNIDESELFVYHTISLCYSCGRAWDPQIYQSTHCPSCHSTRYATYTIRRWSCPIELPYENVSPSQLTEWSDLSRRNALSSDANAGNITSWFFPMSTNPIRRKWKSRICNSSSVCDCPNSNHCSALNKLICYNSPLNLIRRSQIELYLSLFYLWELPRNDNSCIPPTPHLPQTRWPTIDRTRNLPDVSGDQKNHSNTTKNTQPDSQIDL